METLDLILLGVILLFALMGLFKGILKQLATIFGIIFAFGTSFFMTASVSKFLQDKNYFYMYTALSDKVNTVVEGKLGEIANQTVTKASDITDALVDFGIPKFLSNLVSNLGEEHIDTGETIGEVITSKLSFIIFMGIIFIGLAIFIYIIVKLIFRLLQKTVDKAKLGWLNKTLGCVFGAFKAIIIISVFMLLLSYFVTLIPSLQDYVNSNIVNNDKAYISKWLYENNLIQYVFILLPKRR